jgi:hypothetical protein
VSSATVHPDFKFPNIRTASRAFKFRVLDCHDWLLSTLCAMLPCRLSPSNCTSLVIKRYISRAPAKDDARKRALVSLYHQCDTFITPENLSQKIDEAFVPLNGINLSSNLEKRSYAELRRLVIEREEQPRHFFGKGNNKPSSTALRVALSSSSPNNEKQRTARAMEALVGMSKDGKPLWTTLKKDGWRIRGQLKADRRQGV